MRHTLCILLSLLMILTLTAALAEGAPTSQFGFSGWPYRNGTGCGQQTKAPASGQECAACTASPTQRPTAKPTAKPTEKPSTISRGDYTTTSLSAQEQKMLEMLNSERQRQGLSALTPDPELSRIARIKCEDMRDNRYFAHESPIYGNMAKMLRTFGYPYNGAGENIAHHANIAKAHAAFMSSTGHRGNILGSQWKKVGIGICLDANGFVYVTEIFVR